MSKNSQPTVPLEAESPFELRTDLSRDVAEAELKAAVADGSVGYLHSFTTGSAVDGPGVRVVAWTTGCQFRCLYCHNPDTWKLRNGMPVTLARATEELSKYRNSLKIMNGGFTLSGGEPLMQDRFAIRLFAAARKMGIHTALDTNGFLGERLSDEELTNIDLVLLDIKAWDAARHKHLTSQDNAPVLDFARRLARLKRPVSLRYVLVPGLTDDAADIAQIAAFAAQMGNMIRVDVLPFHQMGRFKWEALKMDYTLNATQPPTSELVNRCVEQFRAVGLEAY